MLKRNFFSQNPNKSGSNFFCFFRICPYFNDTQIFIDINCRYFARNIADSNKISLEIGQVSTNTQENTAQAEEVASNSIEQMNLSKRLMPRRKSFNLQLKPFKPHPSV
ncbi:hypothetical protein [Desulfosporosinus nitroreducens]|uniref:Uncharacterized protein n=1 Tax=Desulfosporosinus nitroreducens TaxID=2018668 RepID=A0ABT8QY89_9FIRM|nr:hypothetical protein [Desulfosporosinus nitroreducens]MDO0824866.1 hypothetical protein [Desulfosporosinus nitroreducens]